MFDAATAGYYYTQAQHVSLRHLEEAVGGLTQTSKMPWLSYSLPALACQTGSKLRDVAGSVCSKCYACKGFYCMPNVQAAQEKRLRLFFGDPERWAGYMAALIERKASNITDSKRFFRWHDSGDVQSADHFDAIVWIAERVPSVRFYLPTKERWVARDAQLGAIPVNLTVRLSAPMLGQTVKMTGPNLYATVGAGEGNHCPADDGNEYKCGDCRACWDRLIRLIDYTQH